MSEQDIICPKCGYTREKIDDEFVSREECPKCGIVYKKCIGTAPLSEEIGANPENILSTSSTAETINGDDVGAGAYEEAIGPGPAITDTDGLSKKDDIIRVEPPTARQLDYAIDLGINIPDNATKEEVSDLIDFHVRRDKSVSRQYQDFAKEHRVRFTQFTGKKTLFDRILHALKQPGKEEDMVSWFVYRVYRELVHGEYDVPIKSPKDPAIQAIASELIKDVSVIKSIRRYAGNEIIWFGQWTTPEGYVRQGGSNRTIAYRRTSSALTESLGLKPRVRSSEKCMDYKSPTQTAGHKPGKREVKNSAAPLSWPTKLVVGFFLFLVLVGILKSCH